MSAGASRAFDLIDMRIAPVEPMQNPESLFGSLIKFLNLKLACQKITHLLGEGADLLQEILGLLQMLLRGQDIKTIPRPALQAHQCETVSLFNLNLL